MTWRHDSLTRLLYSDPKTAKRRPVLEKRDPIPRRSRPDIQCLGTTGSVDFIELSVRHPLLGKQISRSAWLKTPRKVLDQLESDKAKKHAEILAKNPESDLLVVALTTLGGWNKSARECVNEIVKSSASRNMDEPSYARLTSFVRYAARLVAGNVHCLTEGLVTASVTNGASTSRSSATLSNS